MNRATVGRILIIVAIAVALVIGIGMLRGKRPEIPKPE